MNSASTIGVTLAELIAVAACIVGILWACNRRRRNDEH